MFIIKQLQCVILLVTGILISQAFAQPANLVLENITISTTELFEATNSITVGSNVTITSSGNVTLDAPAVTLKDMVFVIEGGELLVLSQTTAVDVKSVDVKSEEMVIPNEFVMNQNYPNPFNPTTRITYQIPELSFVTLKVFDVLGNEIKTLVNEEKPVGYYEIKFDASSLASGIYIYQLHAGSFIETKKMILLR